MAKALDKKAMLIAWLRSKGFHVADIALAIKWYEEQCVDGEPPSDRKVYEVAEKCHLEAINKSKERIPPIEVSLRYKIKGKVIALGFMSGVVGAVLIFLIERYLWPLVQTQLP